MYSGGGGGVGGERNPGLGVDGLSEMCASRSLRYSKYRVKPALLRVSTLQILHITSYISTQAAYAYFVDPLEVKCRIDTRKEKKKKKKSNEAKKRKKKECYFVHVM